MTAPYRNFDRQTWPVPCVELDDIRNQVRYAPKDFIFSMEERLIIASVLDGYSELVEASQAKRNAVIRELRKGPNV